MKALLVILILCFVSACSQAQTTKQPVQTATPTNTNVVIKKVETNSIGMEFISIAAGEFLMGASENDLEDYSNEKPQHKVSVSKPFFIGKYEVTQANWEAVMGSNYYEKSIQSNHFIFTFQLFRQYERAN